MRGTIRGFIEALLEEELEAALGRARYARLKTAAGEQAAAGLGNGEPAAGAVRSTGHRHGRRERQVMGSFGAITVAVPRARLDTADGRTAEWVNKTLPAYRRRTREVDALIAGAYLAGTNTRRVGRALTVIFRGAISRSTVSRVWRQIKADWESWNRRDLGQEDIVRLILDGTVVKVRLDKKATSISLRRFSQTHRPLKAVSALKLRKPMRIASHIATALSAATGRSNRPNGWQRIGVCMAYEGFSSSTIDRASQGSRLKPE